MIIFEKVSITCAKAMDLTLIQSGYIFKYRTHGNNWLLDCAIFSVPGHNGFPHTTMWLNGSQRTTGVVCCA